MILLIIKYLLCPKMVSRFLIFGLSVLFAVSSCTFKGKIAKSNGTSKSDVIPFDDIRPGHWPEPFELVQIPSSLDENVQKAWFFPTPESEPQPLLISLHTWSGDYNQKDTLATMAIDENWNYIHPDFRGPNWTQKACCSSYVLDDIDQAIDFALENGNVDTSRIYVNGVSGGGYAALAVYMRSRHTLKSISAWVPISDLSAWYDQSVERGNKYADHIKKCTGSSIEELNRHEARERSPMFWETPKRNTSLQIYTGVHDGVQGSVPITQSIRFYNKLVRDKKVDDPEKLVPSDEVDFLLRNRIPVADFGKIGERTICLEKKIDNISLIIFDGGHEMLPEVAFETLFAE